MSIGQSIPSYTMSRFTTPPPSPRNACSYIKRTLMPWMLKFENRSISEILSNSPTSPIWKVLSSSMIRWKILALMGYWQSSRFLQSFWPPRVWCKMAFLEICLKDGVQVTYFYLCIFHGTWIDRRNGVILAGYFVEGTMAREIMTNPEEIQTLQGQKLPLKMQVEYMSFSAHVDYRQISGKVSQN